MRIFNDNLFNQCLLLGQNYKELWQHIEVMYMQENATSKKKFLIFNFLNYKMVNKMSLQESRQIVARK